VQQLTNQVHAVLSHARAASVKNLILPCLNLVSTCIVRCISFAGTQEQLAAELQRLSKLASELSAGDATVAAAAAAAGGGRSDPLLSLLLQWRQQRQAAVAAEIARMSAAAAAAAKSRTSSWTMLHWLTQPVSKLLAAW
jgi:hypothetical protein